MATAEKKAAVRTDVDVRGALSPERERVSPSTSTAPDPNPDRWDGVLRPYGPADVDRLRGSVQIEYTLARRGAERLWRLLHCEEFVPALGALTGNQAVQMVRAGLEAIYLSGWQVAADANTAGQTYPDQSLYPADSVPAMVRRINRALQRADQIERSEGRVTRDWFAPIVADAEAGFGGPLNAFELMKALIEAGAAAAHFEDQLSSEKKCGHLGGKVLLPISQFIRALTAARLAADVLGVPTVLIARTDAHSAQLITSDVDPRDREFVVPGARTPEGFHRLRGGIACAIARGIAYAPYADMVWCETSTPDLGEARQFAEAIHEKFPGKLLAYNCSPSFNWKKNLDDATIARFQRELAAMGYKFQFVTLAGFHALNHATFELARGYRERGMAAYTKLQQAEFAAERDGYTATRHQREAGTGYFDAVTEIISAGTASTFALRESTEAAQFARGDGLGHFEAELHDDHQRVNEIAGRLEAAPDLAAMAAALDDLRSALREHFAHEEKAEGFFGLLRARAHTAASELQRVMSEHAPLLDTVGRLADRARSSATARADIAEEARRITAMLQEHEQQEVALMAAARA